MPKLDDIRPVELVVYANRSGHGTQPFIVTDHLFRFRMSASLVDMLGIRKQPYQAYLAFDKANKRVMIGPVDVVKPTDANPVTFDAGRHYTRARGFFETHAIPTEPTRYYYDGKWQGWLAFRREGWTPEDGRGT